MRAALALPLVLAVCAATSAHAAPSPAPRVVQVVPGHRYFFALFSDGSVRAWGGHSDAAAEMKRLATPTAIAGWSSVKRLSARGLCAITSDGYLSCLDGAPPLPQQSVATRVLCAKEKHPAACDKPAGFGVAATHLFRGGLCARLADGSTSCLDDALQPIAQPAKENVVDIADPCELLAGGEVRCSGKPVVGLGSAQAIVADAHGCAIRTNGTVACWQIHGHYGNEPGTNTAHEVAVVKDARALAIGLKQACALDARGDVHCWYLRGYYDGRATSYDRPLKMVGGATEIAMGALFACARKSDGTVACWGMNAHGQLGTGDKRPRTDATTIAGLAEVDHVSTGPDQACAVKKDGSLLCWGFNLYGAIGDHASGVALEVTTPTPIKGLP
jgi:hypothetical protein